MKCLVLITLIFVCAGCIKPVSPVTASLENEGEVFVYLEPFPQDAGRLTFTLAGMSAVKDDGVEIPLTLRMTDFTSGSIRRQRLMAVGALPAGEYRGFSFRVKNAILRSEEGSASLLVAEKGDMHDFPFSVGKRRASVVSLSFRFRESVKGGYGFSPVFAMEIPANPLPTLTGYVSNSGSHEVTVFDKRSARVVKVIQTGRNPSGLALDHVQMKAYVALSGDDAVEIIDVMQNEVVSRLPLKPGDAPEEIALTPDGRSLITVNSGSNTVSFLDPVSQVELSRLTVGNRPVSVLLDPAGRRAYVFNSLSASISVIDIASRSVAGSIATESGPLRGQFNRKGDRLYICHSQSPSIIVIDPRSFSLLKRIAGGMGISSLKVNPFNDLLYVGKRFDGLLDVYDPFSFIPGDFLPTAGGVADLAIDRDEKNVAVVHPAQNSVQLINLVSKKEVAVIDVGDQPSRVVMFGER